MAVYVGSDIKRRIRLGSSFMRILSGPLFEGVVLKSFDNFALKDSSDKYLTVKGDR